jgi:hypothetical protein
MCSLLLLGVTVQSFAARNTLRDQWSVYKTVSRYSNPLVHTNSLVDWMAPRASDLQGTAWRYRVDPVKPSGGLPLPEKRDTRP